MTQNPTLIGLDLETTGYEPETARIVSACVGLYTEKSWLPTMWLLRQNEPIPDDAIAIHGISTEYANLHGEDPVAALVQIRDALYQHWSTERPVVAFNAPYDLTVLDRCLGRANLGHLEIRGPVIDPKVIDKHTDKYRKGKRRLGDLCTHYGIALTDEDAHTADGDARATCSLAWILATQQLPPGQEVWSTDDLNQLHQLQTQWHRDQVEDFANYRRRVGNPLSDVNTDWPIRERDLMGAQARS